MGDTERQRFAVVLEIVPCLIDVVAGAALQVAVLGHVVLELQTGDETVLADRIADFVRHDVRADLAQVAVREGVETERRVYGAVALVFFQNVYGREEFAVVAARLVLMRVGVAQRVGQTAFEEARIQLGGYRCEVLLLIVARILEIHGVIRSTAVVVAVIGQLAVQRADRTGRRRRILVLGTAEAYVERVVAVDVPVYAGHKFVAGRFYRIALVGTGVVAVFVDQEIADFVEFFDRRTVVLRAAAEALTVAGACQTRRSRRGVPLALEVGEHEELVLDDRGADAEAEGGVAHFAQRQFAAVVLVALKLVALGENICRSLEFVGSRLGYGVDRTARKAALANVVGGDRYRHLLQCVERDGRAACGQVAADAEGVVERGAVDRYVRLTVVTAADRQTRRGGRSLRREVHDVVHAAAYRRHQLDLLAGDARNGACAVYVHRAVAAVGRNDYGFERLAVLQESVAREGFAQLQFESGELDALITHEREGHGVGTARTQALQVVAAVLVGHGAVLRTRRGVHGDNGGAGEGLALFVGNRTVHARSRHLRGSRGDGENREHQNEKFLHTK